MSNRAFTFFLRGLLITGVLFFYSTVHAVELKVSITPPSPKEYTIEVTDQTGMPQKKLTIDHTTTFDVQEGFVNIVIEGKKKIKKIISKPSMLQVLFYD